MKSELDTETTAEQKFDRFRNALYSIASVSKRKLSDMLAAEKIANSGKLKRGPKPKHSPSGPASDDEG